MANRKFKIQFSTLGPDLDNFSLVGDGGPVSPATVTRAQLLSGVEITTGEQATVINVSSSGTCGNSANVFLKPRSN